MDKAHKEGTQPKYSLPESERIYYKDFHFLEEPLIDRQRKKEEQKRAKKLAAQKLEETKAASASVAQAQAQQSMPMFSNQKDD